MCKNKLFVITLSLSSIFAASGCGSSDYHGYIKMRNQACTSSLGEYDPVKDVCLCPTAVGGISCNNGWVCDNKSSKCRACIDGERKCENGKYSECWDDMWIDIPASSPFYVTCDKECDEYGKGSEVMAREDNCVPDSPFTNDIETPREDCENMNECKLDDNDGKYKMFTCKNGIEMATNEICDECGEDGKCVKKIKDNDECVENESRCDNNIHKVCQKDGDRLIWKQQEPCDYGCADEICACNINVDPKCEGNYVVTCENGSWKEVLCDYGCVNGACKCKEEDVRCSGIDVQTCRDGKWITDASCSNGCSEGKCNKVCVDGDKKCDGNKVKICTNGEWEDGEECAENQNCDNGKCVEKTAIGKCVNGSKMCDTDVSGASVLKTCENGNWNSENCLECKQTDKTNAECVKFGEGCKNECIEDVAYVCIDNVSTQIGCSKRCGFQNGVLLCAGCAENHKNGKDFRCVDCIDKSDCGDGYVCEENNCIPTIDSMCQSVSCINDGNGIGELQCSDKRTVKCDNASCNGNVCGECLNGNTRCSDGKLQKCEDGKWGNGMNCQSLSKCEDNGDGKAKCVKEEIEKVCVNGETKCSGDKLQKCEEGQWDGGIDCPNGCKRIDDGNAVCKGGGNEESSGYGGCASGDVGKFKCGYERIGDKIIAIILKCNNSKNWEKFDVAGNANAGECIKCGKAEEVSEYSDRLFKVDITGANLCVGSNAYLCTTMADSGKTKSEWIYNGDCSSQ